MRYELAQLTRRANPNLRRRAIVIRDIPRPAILATDLYRACYAPIVQMWDRAAAAIAQAYSESLALRVQDARAAGEISAQIGAVVQAPAAHFIDSPADIQARIDAASTEFERLILTLQAALEDWGIRTERWQRSKWRDAVLSATGIDLSTLIGPEDVRETVDQYVRWNVALIRDVSNQAQTRITNSVFAGVQNRTPARDVAKQIREAVDMSRTRSIGIASDQLSKLTSALADERRREAGLSVWKWRHSGKRHPREVHRARDGNLYADDPAMVGREVDGVTVVAPPAENDRPGRPPWCGCRSQSVMIFD